MAFPIELDEVHRLVGLICVATTSLEQELEDTVESLVGSPRTPALIQGQRGNITLEQINRLLDGKLLEPPHVEKLKGLCRRTKRLLEARDKVTHSRWLVKKTADAGVVTGTRTRRSSIGSHDWTIAQLQTVADEIAVIEVEWFIATRDALEGGNQPD